MSTPAAGRHQVDEHHVPWPPPHWNPGDPPMIRLLVTAREYDMLMAIRHAEIRKAVERIRVKHEDEAPAAMISDQAQGGRANAALPAGDEPRPPTRPPEPVPPGET